jgi:eukaryotic-like serine/threonine-protein kinase
MSDAPQGSPARTFGRFRVARLLGAGGMGEVFLAHDELLGREVAIKTLNLQTFEVATGESFRARFLNEARAIAALSHPNVVQVFDLGFEGETPYLVMEVVGGPSLRERLRQGRRLSHAEARALGIQVGGALAAAHARGILHRDVKPANLLEAEPGVWKLADFGVARTPDSSLTQAGQFLGSPAYAAPEALLLGQFSPASDVFGLGATLYEALCGEPPYGEAPKMDLGAVAAGQVPIAIGERCPDIPTDLARVIGAAIARDRGARPAAARMAEELEGVPQPATVVAGTLMAPVSATPVAAVSAAGATRPGVPHALQTAASTSHAAASSLSPRAPVAPRRSRVLLVGFVLAGALIGVGVGVGFGVGAYLSDGAPPVSSALGPQEDARAAPAPAPVAPPPVPPPVTQIDAAVPPAPAVAADAASAAVRDASPPARDAQPSRAEQKRRIQRALDQGRLDEARRDLEDFVRRHPDDQEGPRLLEYLKATQAGLGGEGKPGSR